MDYDDYASAADDLRKERRENPEQRHWLFSADVTLSPEMLERVEGNRMSIVSPHGSAHIPTSIVDTHQELVRSMLHAARQEYLNA